ncbi:hypothetical protein VTJ49DRAFT_4267 [Mycothermus thermophilus]|uniref:mitogen-activated protein kinase kinase n=1 Tax=Humicola insolens TaxID=85995 RepID=A0ABR3VM61_HUMIN
MGDHEYVDPVTPADQLPPTIAPVSPGSPDDSSQASTPLDTPSADSDIQPPSPSSPGDLPRRVPGLRAISDPHTSHMSASSSVTGLLNTVRRPTPSATNLPSDLMAKARALQEQRLAMASRGAGPPGSGPGGVPMGNLNMHRGGSPTGSLVGGVPTNLKLPGMLPRPMPPGFPKSAPAVPGAKKPPSLSERRAMKLGNLPGSETPSPVATPRLPDLGKHEPQRPALNGEGQGSRLSDFKKYIDTEKGWITFDGAATITRTGVNFANGQTFSISLEQVEVLEELGKGNYGTVYKVRHARPKAPRFGQGLSQFRKPPNSTQSLSTEPEEPPRDSQSQTSTGQATSGVIMAMKEIRLELDEAKFATILKELVILHECVSPYIIDFYGAFFQEGAVYMCIECMDAGSIDKLYAGGIPEEVLRRITYSAIMGLKTLKDDHNIIHRDVKPTNILVNTRGQVKICDFGVSGNLVASIAKTNIGCQSYMAPERINGGALAPGAIANGTYNVQSDIWSLGLTIIECAMGRYPYPPEVSSTIFGQLSAIVDGDPPSLPSEGFSPHAHDFVRCCLNKNPHKRHTYPMLLAHPWIQALSKPETITEEEEGPEAQYGHEKTVAGDAALADTAERALRLDNTTTSSNDNKTGDGMPGQQQQQHQRVEGDPVVAAWVRTVLARKNRDNLGNAAAGIKKPALHAAPLDSVSPVGSPMRR